MNEYNSFTCSQCGFGLSDVSSAANTKNVPSAADNTKRCPHCGTVQAKDAKYCKACRTYF